MLANARERQVCVAADTAYARDRSREGRECGREASLGIASLFNIIRRGLADFGTRRCQPHRGTLTPLPPAQFIRKGVDARTDFASAGDGRG